jgi:isopentenyl-diphosphate delta-isomerase
MNEHVRPSDIAGIEIPTWVNGTLQPYDKLAAHVEGLRHKAISVFIMAGDDVLIQQRALHKYHTPGLWANTCCTHPMWGEAMNACATRRLDEELGLKNVDLIHRGSVEYRADVGGGLIEHEAVEVYLGQTTHTHPFTPNPDEVMATDWINYDALISQTQTTPEKFTPWLRIYLEKHRDLIFG